jgi:adhesin transport system membrane fusion protein
MKKTGTTKARGTLSMTLLLFAGLAGFLAWTAWFEIDQTVRASGKLIPGARTQIIQAADGGVLAAIFVREGQTVRSGERLAELESARANAALGESRSRQAALEAALIRAQAEVNQASPVFGPKFKEFPQLESAQKALFKQRQRGLSQELATLREALLMAKEEQQMSQVLLSTGDASRLEVMRAQRQVGEIDGKINATRNKYLQDARIEATKIAEELAANHFKLQERQSVRDHTTLTAPITGIVKYMKVTTVGGVLRVGDELMQISPTEADMVVEININPADIGQLRLGMPTSLKLDAFDYAIYGTLSGKLTHISSDTFTEQGPSGQTATYYRGQISLDAAPVGPGKLSPAVLKPGMTVVADVRTANRSILQYMVKPVLKAFSGALNER